METPLLSASDLSLTRQHKLRVPRRLSGLLTGEQRSTVYGSGIEFADYREYQMGDDVRNVDWSVYLRHQKLMVKLHAEEKELSLMILLDTSNSMSAGSGSKLLKAKQIAGILAGIALEAGGRSGLVGLGAELPELCPVQRQTKALSYILGTLSRITGGDAVDPEQAPRRFAARYGRRCIAVLISDLLYPGWETLIRGLGAAECQCHVVQVLDEDEIDPPQLGEATLIDSEIGEEVALFVDPSLLADYRRELKSFLDDTRRSCSSVGVGYSLVNTSLSNPAIFMDVLRKGGLLC